MDVEGTANIPADTTNMEVEKETSENASDPVNPPKVVSDPVKPPKVIIDDGPPGDDDFIVEETPEPPSQVQLNGKPEEAKADMPERTGVKRPAPSGEESETTTKNQEGTADWRSKIDTSKLSKREKSLLGNMTYEEETELRKNTSLGAVLSGLSTGSYGSDAKKNVVKVEARPNWNRFGRWGNNRRNFNGGFGGGWGGNWGQWEEPSYEEEEMEQDGTGNDEWIAEENKLLEEEFGPGMVTLMNDEGQGMVYVCEICQAQMNGRKSLDVHVNGMKHLKKKNIWEKKHKLESFEGAIAADGKDTKESDKVESSTKSDPSGDTGKDQVVQGQGGNMNVYPSLGMGMPGTLPPYGFPMGGQRPPMATLPPSQWGDFSNPPPPPPITPKPEPSPAVEEKPKVKSNLSGGATGTLLQKLAACAVKNFKDSDLATNVVISLVKAMKEFNHTKGDTKSIEVLTEIDVKLRGLKAQMAALTPDSDKKKSTSKNKIDDKENSNKTAAAPTDPSKNTAYYATASDRTTAPTDPSKYAAYYATSGTAPDGVGTWYSQGKGTNMETSQQYHPSGVKKAAPTSSSYSVPDAGKVDGSSYAKNTAGYDTSYSAYTATQNTMPTKDVSGYSSKPAYNYYSQPSYSAQTGQAQYNSQTGQAQYSSQTGQAQKAVYDIINSTAVPPPPPPDAANVAAYSSYAPVGYQGPYSGYYNAAPDQSQGNYTL